MVSDACLSAGSIVPAERAPSQHVSPSATAYVETGVLGPSAGILGRSVLSPKQRGRWWCLGSVLSPGQRSGVTMG